MLVAGCKPQANVVSGRDPAGVYALVSVNGNQLPARVTHDGTALQARSGSFTINADGVIEARLKDEAGGILKQLQRLDDHRAGWQRMPTG